MTTTSTADGGTRRLSLAGAPNARDLGGHRTGDGRVLRYGQVFRSGALSALTERDLRNLKDRGLRTVIDLRGAAEVAGLGADRLPEECVGEDLPVFDLRLGCFAILSGTLTAKEADHLLADGAGKQVMTAMYRAFVSDAALRDRFATALKHLADPRDLPALLHCTAGKDRTGWFCALLLGALGVPRDDVLTDYLRTNELLGEQTKAAVQTLCARQGIKDPSLVQPLLDASPEYLAAAYAEADHIYGSFATFLREGLNLTPRLQEDLAANLLD